MKKILDLSVYNRMHFIGVGGVSMSGLCKYYSLKGVNVSGSDKQENDATKNLENQGIKIFKKHSKNNVKGSNTVIYTSAISQNNPELKFARKKSLKIIKRSEALSYAMNEHQHKIAVSGSHGKTTATSMIADIFIENKMEPTVFLGGESYRFGNFLMGNGNWVIAEACEYKKNILDIVPDIGVILNVDDDHQDSYKGINDEIATFSSFAQNGISIVCADDENAMKVECKNRFTYSTKQFAYVSSKNIRKNKNGFSFSVYRTGIYSGRINLKIKGIHNVYNALAAIAVAFYCNISFSVIKKALENFHEVKRRNEFLGRKFDIEFYADYAHHPREIEAEIADYDDDTLFVFQPHTYSRTEYLFNEFLVVLSKMKNLIILSTYAAREKYNKKGSALKLQKTLLKFNPKVTYAKNFNELNNLININSKNVKKILFIGAGNIYDYAKKIYKNFVK